MAIVWAGDSRNYASRFWNWWWPAITSWLPSHVRERWCRERPCIVVAWDGVEFDPVALEQAANADAVVTLPKQQVLVRSMRVPVAALNRLRKVMTYEVERQTPFSIANVYFDVLLTTAPVKGATAADVLLVVAPKASVDAVYQQASSLLPQLRGIDVVDSDGVLLGANLLLPNMRYRPSTRWRAWNMALASILAIALFGTLFGVLQARQRGAGVMEKQATPVLLTADRIGQRQRELRDLRRVLAQSGSNETTHAQALQLLSDVSALLPEDTYLIQLRLNRPVIAVRGRTHDLPTLLKRLGTSTLWGDPKLTGSRSLEDGQGEEFSLELHVRASVAGRP